MIKPALVQKVPRLPIVELLNGPIKPFCEHVDYEFWRLLLCVVMQAPKVATDDFTFVVVVDSTFDQAEVDCGHVVAFVSLPP